MLEKIKSFIFKSDKNLPKVSINYLNDLKYFKAARYLFSSLEKYNINYKLMFVGGCVRKLLSEEQIKDIDIATNIEPKELIKILNKEKIQYFKTGIEHGTLTVVVSNLKFEITTLRKDLNSDGRHANVQFISDWEIDAQRRDFTINAIYTNTSGEIYDPLNGVEDLKNGKVCFIGDPNIRIKEDYLRIIRYIRFFTQYSQYDHEKEIIKSIKINLDNCIKLSKERLLQELYKILELKKFNNIFKNKFSSFIILSLFPQFKNYSRLNILKKVSNRILLKINKNLILSILLIDKTDDSEYFIYKYNLSNEAKKLILFIKESYKNYSINYILDKKNLLKFCYLNSKELVISFLVFQIFNFPKKIKKIESIIEYVESVQVPEFPIKAYYLKHQFNFSEGKKLGDALKKLENIWLEDNFKIEKNKIESILKI